MKLNFLPKIKNWIFCKVSFCLEIIITNILIMLAISIFYMLVMTISSAEFSRNWFPYVNMSSRKPSQNFFRLSTYFSPPLAKPQPPCQQSYLTSALLVCPSALKSKSTSVSIVSPMLGSGVLGHFTFGNHQKAKKPPSAADLPWLIPYFANEIDKQP